MSRKKLNQRILLETQIEIIKLFRVKMKFTEHNRIKECIFVRLLQVIFIQKRVIAQTSGLCRNVAFGLSYISKYSSI